MSTVSGLGRQILRAAHLAPDLYAACVEALAQPGRIFSANPAWSRLFLAWLDALVEPASREPFLAAAVACEFMATAYDLLDDVYDHAGDAGPLTRALPAGTTLLLLAQQTLTSLALPAPRRGQACRILARTHRRFCAGQVRDYTLRGQLNATHEDVLAVMRLRSGTLVAAPCQCAAVLAGASWRTVGLAGRFGQTLGCAAQLEDDLADCADDVQTGRTTIPTLLIRNHHGAQDVAAATSWVLMDHFLREAADVLYRLPAHVRTDSLWMLLPTMARVA